MPVCVLFLLIFFAFSWVVPGESLLAFQNGVDEARRAVLARDASPSAFLDVLSFPELLEEKPVLMKIFRSLSFRNPEIFQAALSLYIRAPQLRRAAPIQKRVDAAFVEDNPHRQKIILQLAENDPTFLRDLRFVGLIKEGLRVDSPLQEIALSFVKKEKWLRENPAIAQALMARSDPSAPVDVKLPDYQFFKETVESILTTPGPPDDEACINCHKTHPIFRLRPIEAGREEQAVRAHYSSALLVVDLQEPERSLLLRKPTFPTPPRGNVILPPSADVHDGGVRWEKGSSSYRTILKWIRTASP